MHYDSFRNICETLIGVGEVNGKHGHYFQSRRKHGGKEIKEKIKQR
jgi:hypothetical protein